MNSANEKISHQLQSHWYLGFLGFVGIYKLPLVWACLQGEDSLWNLTNLLWLLWFSYFLPKTIDDDSLNQNYPDDRAAHK